MSNGVSLLAMYTWVLCRLTEMDAWIEVCEWEGRRVHEDLEHNHRTATVLLEVLSLLIENPDVAAALRARRGRTVSGPRTPTLVAVTTADNASPSSASESA